MVGEGRQRHRQHVYPAPAMDSWSTVSVGLQQHTQQQVQFTRLANNADTLPLQILTRALEPAQYYTRQHLKFRAGNYHQFEPLNRLADALNAESATVRQMNKWADRLVSDAEDTESADALRHVFNRWQSNTSDALALSENSYQLKAIKPVIQEVDKLSSIGLRLTDLVARRARWMIKRLRRFRANWITRRRSGRGGDCGGVPAGNAAARDAESVVKNPHPSPLPKGEGVYPSPFGRVR